MSSQLSLPLTAPCIHPFTCFICIQRTPNNEFAHHVVCFCTRGTCDKNGKHFGSRKNQGLFIGFLKTRTREVDLLDGFQKAHNLRCMIGIFHRGSVSSISVTGSTTSTTTFFQYIFVNHYTLRT